MSSRQLVRLTSDQVTNGGPVPLPCRVRYPCTRSSRQSWLWVTSTSECFKWVIPGVFFVDIRLFKTNIKIFTTNVCQKYTGIRTHDLLNMSLLP